MVSKNLPKMVKQILSVPGPWSQHVNILYAPGHMTLSEPIRMLQQKMDKL